jgi:AcrR family transcriptional regulator
MAEVMAEKGYVSTSVADVLQRAGVSRQSFYALFDSKLDCFMAAFGCAGELLLDRLVEVVGDSVGGPSASRTPAGENGTGGAAVDERLALCERAITAYVDALAEELPYARLFLVEVYAAGPEAIARRTRMQETITDALADLIGATGEPARFTCRMIVAAMSAMVTAPAAEMDAAALRALGPALIEHVRVLWEAGVLGAVPAHPRP